MKPSLRQKTVTLGAAPAEAEAAKEALAAVEVAVDRVIKVTSAVVGVVPAVPVVEKAAALAAVAADVVGTDNPDKRFRVIDRFPIHRGYCSCKQFSLQHIMLSHLRIGEVVCAHYSIG